MFAVFFTTNEFQKNMNINRSINDQNPRKKKLRIGFRG